MGGFNKKITLAEASKISGYHPDYLSYLIRKKQLIGVKIGRNWFTTKENLREYLFKRNPHFDFFITPKKIKYILFFSILIIVISSLMFSNFDDGKNSSNFSIYKKLNTEVEQIGLANQLMNK